MTRKPWTPFDIDMLRALYADNTAAVIGRALGRLKGSIYSKAEKLGLLKSESFYANEKSKRIHLGTQSPAMIATQFSPGNTPWNKGRHYVAGGRSIETRFKKGELAGAAARNWVPVGTYRINGEGILDRKITDLGRGPRDWEGVHRLAWKSANGALPAGHIVVFRPGRKTSALELITPDAVEAITRAENVRRNHPRNKSAELASLYQLKGAINRQVNRINREASEAQTKA